MGYPFSLEHLEDRQIWEERRKQLDAFRAYLIVLVNELLYSRSLINQALKDFFEIPFAQADFVDDEVLDPQLFETVRLRKEIFEGCRMSIGHLDLRQVEGVIFNILLGEKRKRYLFFVSQELVVIH